MKPAHTAIILIAMFCQYIFWTRCYLSSVNTSHPAFNLHFSVAIFKAKGSVTAFTVAFTLKAHWSPTICQAAFGRPDVCSQAVASVWVKPGATRTAAGMHTVDGIHNAII